MPLPIRSPDCARRPAGPALSLIALLAVACAPADRPPEVDASLPRVEFDSAGVTIVETREPAWTTPWRVGAEPLLSIDEQRPDGAPLLERPVDAVRLEDGSLVVGDAATRQIHWLGPEGTRLRTRGQEGSGTGEFRTISGLLRLPADSVAVYDASLRRLTIYGPEGEPGRAHTLSGFPVGIRPTAQFADGSLLIGAASGVVPVAAPGPADVRRPPLEVLRLDPVSGSADILALLPGTEVGVTPEPGSTTGFRYEPRVPFGRSTRVAGEAHGWVSGDNERWEIRFWTPEGALTRIARRPFEPREVTAAERSLALSDFSTAAVRQALQRSWSEWSALPATMPAWNDLLLDREGYVWVESFSPPGLPRSEWSVVAPDGRWLGTLEIPEGLRLVEVGRDWILGFAEAPNGTPSLRLYPLERSPDDS